MIYDKVKEMQYSDATSVSPRMIEQKQNSSIKIRTNIEQTNKKKDRRLGSSQYERIKSKCTRKRMSATTGKRGKCQL